MSKWTICLLFAMILCHVIDEFISRIYLTRLERKKWRMRGVPEVIHGFLWSFFILIPLLVVELLVPGTIEIRLLPVACLIGAVGHSEIDELKCVLWQDQLAHLLHIIIFWIVFFLI